MDSTKEKIYRDSQSLRSYIDPLRTNIITTNWPRSEYRVLPHIATAYNELLSRVRREYPDDPEIMGLTELPTNKEGYNEYATTFKLLTSIDIISAHVDVDNLTKENSRIQKELDERNKELAAIKKYK